MELLFPPPGDLSHPGMEPPLPDSLSLSHRGNPYMTDATMNQITEKVVCSAGNSP